jgi:hypothetical protein
MPLSPGHLALIALYPFSTRCTLGLLPHSIFLYPHQDPGQRLGPNVVLKAPIPALSPESINAILYVGLLSTETSLYLFNRWYMNGPIDETWKQLGPLLVPCLVHATCSLHVPFHM